jgi:hypothetical protein
MNNHVIHSYHIPGALVADLAIRFTAPGDATLLHVSAVGSNAHNATLAMGTSASAAAYMVATAIGVSGTPVEFIRKDFVGTQFPRITKGTIVVLTLDFDGAAGVAAQNVTLVLTFAEG